MQSSYISSGTNQMKHTDSIREETTTSAIFLEIGRNPWVARIRHLPKAMEKHCQNCRQLCILHDGQTLECLKVQNSCQQTKSQAIQTKLLCCCHNLSQQCCSPNKSIETQSNGGWWGVSHHSANGASNPNSWPPSRSTKTKDSCDASVAPAGMSQAHDQKQCGHFQCVFSQQQHSTTNLGFSH